MRTTAASCPRTAPRTQRAARPGIQPCQVVYEDLSRDKLAVVNRVLEFLRLPQLGAGDLPPVRYRKQADSLTERYADLVRSAMTSTG
jgi:LPS sulfotransferase NodH